MNCKALPGLYVSITPATWTKLQQHSELVNQELASKPTAS